MNRTEAMAPLNKGEGRFPVTSGLFVRGGVRRAAIAAMVDFYEEKGLLSSSFIFRGPEDRVIALYNFLKKSV